MGVFYCKIIVLFLFYLKKNKTRSSIFIALSKLISKMLAALLVFFLTFNSLDCYITHQLSGVNHWTDSNCNTAIPKIVRRDIASCDKPVTVNKYNNKCVWGPFGTCKRNMLLYFDTNRDITNANVTIKFRFWPICYCHFCLLYGYVMSLGSVCTATKCHGHLTHQSDSNGMLKTYLL